MTGYIKLYRSVFESEAFDGEPFSRREAWIWLVANAAWKPHEYRFKSTMVPIGRGQLPGARKALAKAWGWGEQRVRTYLELLQSQLMIHLDSNQQLTIITICNYDKYQAEPLESNQQLTSNQPATNHTEEGKELKEDTILQRARADEPTDESEIPGLNGSTSQLVEWLADWLSPFSPDHEAARAILASNVDLYGAKQVHAGMLDLQIQIAAGNKPKNLAKSFSGFVRNANPAPKTTGQTASSGPSEGYQGSNLVAGIVINPEIPTHREPVLDEWDIENKEAANAH